MLPESREIFDVRKHLPTLMVENIVMRAQIKSLRAKTEIFHKALTSRADEGKDTARPAFDWRLVLENLNLGWPDDVIEEATALRDAELRAAVRQ